MTSFLVKKKQLKTFEEKISKLSVRTQQNITAASNSFDRFCQSYYDGRTIEDIFRELNTLKDDEQTQSLQDFNS
jgi:hypothetical protein